VGFVNVVTVVLPIDADLPFFLRSEYVVLWTGKNRNKKSFVCLDKGLSCAICNYVRQCVSSYPIISWTGIK
jgi:hypothetical protein